MNRRPVFLVAAIVLVSAIGALTDGVATALTVKSKPARPELVSISAGSKSVKGRIDVSVRFTLAGTHSRSPLILSDVRVGRFVCTAKQKTTRCTVRNVPVNKAVPIWVRGKNKNGFGTRSISVLFKPAPGKTWQAPTKSVSSTTAVSSTTIGSSTTLPAARVDLTRGRVLGVSQVKLSKVQGVSGAGVSSARVRSFTVGSVVFKTSGVVAYAQAETASQTGSKLLAVSSTGTVSDALFSGSAVIDEFYVAPNGRLYVVFETKVALVNGGTPCLLAEVDVTTGVPSCVDTSLDTINWNLGYNSGSGNSPVQFSSDGSVFYSGRTGSTQILRRSIGGVVTDLINDNISLMDFIVLGDGTVIVTGSTTSSQVYWLRRIAPSGGLKNLAIGTVHRLAKFADGKVYAGLWSNQDFGFKRYLPETDALESKYWLAGNTNGVSRDAYFSADGPAKNVKDCEIGVNYAFCGWYGTIVSPVFNISSQRTLGVAGSSNQERQLWQYYPTVEKSNVTVLRSVNLASQIGSTLVLSGTSAEGVNMMSMYDTTTKQETVVMDSSNEVEIYSMTYNQPSNSILYSGLRFSDNRFVVGEVSLG